MSHRLSLLRHARSLALAAAALSAVPALAFDTLSQDQVLSGPDFASFGSAMDVDGYFSAVVSPENATIETFTFNLSSGSWQAGPTLTPTAEELAPVVAVHGLTIFYAAITQVGANPPSTQSWEIRAQRLFPPQTVVVDSGTGQEPTALAASVWGDEGGDRGITIDVLAVGISRYSSGGGGASRMYEKVGNDWFLIDSWDTTHPSSSHGRNVALHGTWAAFGDPTWNNSDGLVRVFRRDFGWTLRQQIEDGNPLQSGVSFGASVAIDDVCLVIGMTSFNQGFIPPTPDTGGFAAYGVSPEDFWFQEQVLVPEGALSEDYWGFDIDLAGPNLVLGGWRVQRLNLNEQGDAALFRRSGDSCRFGSWSEYARLRATALVIDPEAEADYGRVVRIDPQSGILVSDPKGPTGEGHGRVYAFNSTLLVLFADGFESGDTSGWSVTTP
ncbi:MAG: hypothetical protein DWQ36_14850 [Acidobacteria bacterium]|nr:MAG: hypothetical protein DWQ30_10690 [Acidobacteriota bacterium]REK06170.1 MAG: hypothetical protein DWQ36_14850 [Acidobacteriota bacterium]